jgi:endogenous inhibitor of DNA gyrase (YacG/DUF329 family)
MVLDTAKKGPAPRCPICGKPSVADHVPFCSVKCADIDLGRWLGGEYRIPTDERPGQPEPGRTDED